MKDREALTVRVPMSLLADAREVKAERESFNDFVVDALEREVRRRQGMVAYHAILKLREQIYARTGAQPDSGPLIRSLRDGTGRGD